jgi:predicted nucleic acid-binding protein
MRRYVVDASVILKWVLGDEREPDHEIAMNLLNGWVEGEAELSAPALWQYEVANFLGRQLPKEAAAKMDLLLNLNITNVDLTDGIFRRCFKWMKENRVTFYDVSYLAVAFEIQATLITADERVVKQMGNVNRICLLKRLDLGPP